MGARRDHLIVIVHTRPSPRQAAGIVAVDASTAVVDIAVLVAGTLAGGTVAAGTGLRYLENTVAVHRSTVVSVLVVRQHTAAEELRMNRGTQKAVSISRSPPSRQRRWRRWHHRYQRGYPIQSGLKGINTRYNSKRGGKPHVM